LPAPDPSRPDFSGAFVAPRNSVEEVLAQIWADLLELECVGVNDNFFNIGGHSLLAIRVISRVRQVFRIELPLIALFENPTLVGLAVQVDQLKIVGNTTNEMANLLVEIESLSDEEAERRLAKEKYETSS
jgi:acyl carrier protein